MLEVNADCLNVDRATLVKYLGYRVHQQITYQGLYVDDFTKIMGTGSGINGEESPDHVALEYTFKKCMVIDGSRMSRYWECTEQGTSEELIEMLDSGRSIDWHLNLDNHDSVMYYLDGIWYLLASSDGNYWLYTLDNFDIEAFNLNNFHEVIR